MSALVNALEEAGFVAIVRLVYSNAAGVKLGCLQPYIKSKKEVNIFWNRNLLFTACFNVRSHQIPRNASEFPISVHDLQ